MTVTQTVPLPFSATRMAVVFVRKVSQDTGVTSVTEGTREMYQTVRVVENVSTTGTESLLN